MYFILEAIQIISAILLITIILLVRSEAGVGGSFGGGSDDSENIGMKRRGSEKIIFILCFIIAIIFIISISLPLGA